MTKRVQFNALYWGKFQLQISRDVGAIFALLSDNTYCNRHRYSFKDDI